MRFIASALVLTSSSEGFSFTFGDCEAPAN